MKGRDMLIICVSLSPEKSLKNDGKIRNLAKKQMIKTLLNQLK